jgi:hypothetical protein
MIPPELLRAMSDAYAARLDEVVLVAEVETWLEDGADS